MVEAIIERRKKHSRSSRRGSNDLAKKAALEVITPPKEITSVDQQPNDNNNNNHDLHYKLAPVLERLEKHEEKQVIHQDKIQEEHIQPIIEVHEIPVEKDVYHPVEEIVIREEPVYTTEGEEKLRNTLKTLGLSGEALDRQMTFTLAQFPPPQPALASQVATSSSSSESTSSSQSIAITKTEILKDDQNMIGNESKMSTVSILEPTTTVTTRIEKEIIKKQIIHEIHIQPVIYVHEPFDKLVRETHEFVTEEIPPLPSSTTSSITTSTTTTNSTTVDTENRVRSGDSTVASYGSATGAPSRLNTTRVPRQQRHHPGFFEKLKYSLFGPSRPYQRPVAPMKSQIGDMHVMSPKPNFSNTTSTVTVSRDDKGKQRLVSSSSASP